MQLSTIASLLLAIVAVSCLTGCTGGGTEVPEGFTVGILYNEDGSVAAKASVNFIKDEPPPPKALGKSLSEPPDETNELTVTTNSRGEIVIKYDELLKDGFYYVMGALGVLKSIKDSVFFEDNECDIIIDTLRATGSVTGKVKLYYHQNSRSSFIDIFETKAHYILDDSGTFSLDNLAAGEYNVRIDSKYDLYIPLDTTITIRAGCHDTIPEPILLPYEIRINGFSSTLDLDMRSVTLSWNRFDSEKITGYWLTTSDDANQPLGRMLLNDTATSITLYLKNYLWAQVTTIDLNDKPTTANSSQWLYIPLKKLSIPTVAFPFDSVRAIGFTFFKGKFYILRTSKYNSSVVTIGVYEQDGRFESIDTISEMVINPLAIASKDDSLYLLDQKNDDTLCLRKVIVGDSLQCLINVTIPSNYGIGANLEFGPDGMTYISQHLTTYVIDDEGAVVAKKEGLSSHFALSESGLFTFVDGQPSKAVRFSVTDGNSLDSVNEFVYDPYGLIRDAPKLFVANNKGTVCCLVELSLFVFDEEERFKKQRLYIETGAEIVDLFLTEEDMLYLLYINGRIDVINLNNRPLNTQ
jgi:hypothetical protein